MLRFDHVGVVVDDLEAVIAFFVGLGFERDAAWVGEGVGVDKVVGLEGVRAEVVMVRTPDGSGTLELIKFHAPADHEGAQPLSANRLGFRHIAIEVDDLSTILEGLRARGFNTIGEVYDFEGSYRDCYLRGPEGLIVELAQRIAGKEAV